jgi:PEP-CTERM/exosortase A-associated glycosyltransferase
MKILHVLDHSVPLFSGYSFRSLSIIQAQRAMGLQPVVLTSPKHGSVKDDAEELGGIRYYRTAQGNSILRRVAFARELELMWRLVLRIRQVAAKENIDLIHSHSPLLNGLPALRVARQLGVPLVYEARAFWEDAAVDLGTFAEGSLRYRVSRELENYLFRNADGVVTICDGMQRELRARGISPKCAGVMPNGVDAAQFQPLERNGNLAQRFSLDGKVVFGFIGSFYHYEGLRFLVNAFGAITQRVPGACLLLVGGGPEEPAVRELARSLNGAVILPGRVPHDKIGDYYSLIDVFVCPRRPLRITELVTPLKPLEAMAMEKAILASDVGGHKELIENEKTGVLFAADSADDMIDRASQLAREPNLRQRLGQAGRRYVIQQRAWSELVQCYLPIYDEALRTTRLAHKTQGSHVEQPPVSI